MITLTPEQAQKILELSIGDYAAVRQEYYGQIYFAVFGYLSDVGGLKTNKNAMKRAMVEAFGATETLAWQDGGGDLPVGEEAVAWVTARQQAEIGFIDLLFQQLSELKKEEGIDPEAEATARAEGYTRTLDGLYNEVKAMAFGNKMLTFVGRDGMESCPDCQKLKEQRHRASWWVRRGLIPYRGNINFACGGWRCEHFLVDDQGGVFTL
jgi:hypothetical protein